VCEEAALLAALLAALKGSGRQLQRYGHDPEKWNPVFGQDHAQTKILDYDPIQSNRIIV
jgi:hypothetical protein